MMKLLKIVLRYLSRRRENAEVKAQMRAAERVMSQYRNTLKDLAK
jgi:hypothetical protein